MKIVLLLSIVISVVAVACPLEEHHKLERRLEEEIKQFHVRLNEEQFVEIYKETNNELKRQRSEIEFTESLQSVKNKTGTIKNSGWVNLPSDYKRYARFAVSGNEEKIEYKNILFCENGIGVEKFLFYVNNEKIEIISYELEKVGKKFKFTDKDGKEYVLGQD